MILVTIAENDKYFMRSIGLIFKTNTKVTSEMSESNLDLIKSYLPKKYQSNVIIRLDKVEDVITIGE